MTLKAKAVVKDKFWIIESEEERVGTVSWNDDRYMFSSRVETCFFNSTHEMEKRFGSNIIWNDITPVADKGQLESFSVHGYPTTVNPYNTMYDVKRKLPLFTKSNKSKSAYCAGYYIIHFDKGWVKSFCPKQITVERYEYKGPFKTDLEMRQELSRANR